MSVWLAFGNRKVEGEAKVDTGSSLCLFERVQGESLGLVIENGSPVTINTTTGNFVAYGHEVGLSVLGLETTATVYFAADEQFTRNVLGRQGWLDRVRLGLIDYEGKLFLSDYNES
ncbi:MAG: hypothetical protein JST84_26125 [Acidobacteria bacterium]|nr:hypothetical protein [Acidobacteriota bacterium]